MTRPLKVIYLFTPGPIGGAEKVLMAGLKALTKDQKDVELWLIREKRVPHVMDNFLELIRNTSITYRIFNSRGIFDRTLFQELKTHFRITKVPIIHAHGFKAIFYAYVTKSENTKLVVTHHGKTAHSFKVKIYEAIESFIMKRAHAVIAVSGKMKTELSGAGICDQKIFLVENILSLNHSIQKNTSQEKLKLLFAGRLSPEKGCDFLLEAIKLLPHHLRPCLTIIGDGPLKQTLNEKAKALDILPHVKFLGFQKSVHEYLESCDALVLPSLREGQPLSLIEACCSGLPVLASDVGGIPELVEHQVNGLLFRPGDSQDLADKIQQFIQLKEKIESNAEMRKTAFNQRFSSSTWVRNTQRVYDIVAREL